MALEEAVNELIITAAQERGQALFIWLSRPTPGRECWTGGRWGSLDPAHGSPSQVLRQVVHTRGRAQDIWMH